MIVQINLNDLPSLEALKDGIERLKKDAKIIGRYPTSKKDGDPNNFLKIAAFLEIILERTRKVKP